MFGDSATSSFLRRAALLADGAEKRPVKRRKLIEGRLSMLGCVVTVILYAAIGLMAAGVILIAAAMLLSQMLQSLRRFCQQRGEQRTIRCGDRNSSHELRSPYDRKLLSAKLIATAGSA